MTPPMPDWERTTTPIITAKAIILFDSLREKGSNKVRWTLPRFYREFPFWERMDTLDFVMDKLSDFFLFERLCVVCGTRTGCVNSGSGSKAHHALIPSQAKDTSAARSEDHIENIEAKLLSFNSTWKTRIQLLAPEASRRPLILSGDRSSKSCLKVGSIVEERFNGSWVAAGTSGFQKPADWNSKLEPFEKISASSVRENSCTCRPEATFCKPTFSKALDHTHSPNEIGFLNCFLTLLPDCDFESLRFWFEIPELTMNKRKTNYGFSWCELRESYFNWYTTKVVFF